MAPDWCRRLSPKRKLDAVRQNSPARGQSCGFGEHSGLTTLRGHDSCEDQLYLLACKLEMVSASLEWPCEDRKRRSDASDGSA